MTDLIINWAALGTRYGEFPLSVDDKDRINRNLDRHRNIGDGMNQQISDAFEETWVEHGGKSSQAPSPENTWDGFRDAGYEDARELFVEAAETAILAQLS